MGQGPPSLISNRYNLKQGIGNYNSAGCANIVTLVTKQQGLKSYNIHKERNHVTGIILDAGSLLFGLLTLIWAWLDTEVYDPM